MHQITTEAVNAFMNNRGFRKSNTAVVVTDEKTEMLLFGNVIATKTPGGTYITTAGWGTVTTRERLNGLLRRIDGKYRYVTQRKGSQYLVREDGAETLLMTQRVKIV